jgi:hypothetical protein
LKLVSQDSHTSTQMGHVKVEFWNFIFDFVFVKYNIVPTYQITVNGISGEGFNYCNFVNE